MRIVLSTKKMLLSVKDASHGIIRSVGETMLTSHRVDLLSSTLNNRSKPTTQTYLVTRVIHSHVLNQDQALETLKKKAPTLRSQTKR